MLLYNMLPDCDNSGAPRIPLWLIGIIGFKVTFVALFGAEPFGFFTKKRANPAFVG
jgi:hypothetical protein